MTTISATLDRAYFGAGCFWGVEEAFRQLDGVVETSVGYQGGTPPAQGQNVTYEEVCAGKTGHAEVAEVVYYPQHISYVRLLQIFWSIHDPTQVGRQGVDVGDQYRSAIFTTSEAQHREALQSKAQLESEGHLHAPIATQILPYSPFYRAEEYHQQYYAKRGGGSCGR